MTTAEQTSRLGRRRRSTAARAQRCSSLVDAFFPASARRGLWSFVRSDENFSEHLVDMRTTTTHSVRRNSRRTRRPGVR